jgi:hypothetical protein
VANAADFRLTFADRAKFAGAGFDPLIKAIEAVDVATGQMNRVPDVGVFETNLTFVSHDGSFRVLAFGVTN